jgi:hypothetical protein
MVLKPVTVSVERHLYFSGINCKLCISDTTAFFVIKGPRTAALRHFYQVLQLTEHQWNEIDRGKPTTSEKNLS